MESPYDSAVAAAQLGEEWAWSSLYVWLSPRLLGYVTARGGADPEALLGDVWLEAATKIDRFEGGADQFRRWLFVIAHSRIVDEARRRTRWPEVEAMSEHSEAKAISSAEADVVEAHSLLDLVGKMKGLTELQKSTLLLRTVADLSVADTAVVLGTTVSAVKSAQYHAVLAMREILSGDATKLLARSVT